jgi:hypothetical protein
LRGLAHDRGVDIVRPAGRRRQGIGRGLAAVLRPDLSEQQATDILWLYSSADIYRLLVHDSHWPTARYEQWLAHTLRHALLAPDHSDARHGP